MQLIAKPHGKYCYKVYLGQIFMGNIYTNPEGKSVICYGNSGQAGEYYFGYNSPQDALNKFLGVIK